MWCSAPSGRPVNPNTAPVPILSPACTHTHTHTHTHTRTHTHTALRVNLEHFPNTDMHTQTHTHTVHPAHTHTLSLVLPATPHRDVHGRAPVQGSAGRAAGPHHQPRGQAARVPAGHARGLQGPGGEVLGAGPGAAVRRRRERRQGAGRVAGMRQRFPASVARAAGALKGRGCLC